MTQKRAKYTVAQVANYILGYFFIKEKEITLRMLQFLLQQANGWHIHFYGSRLFDEPIVHWKSGPVIPSIYYYYRNKKIGSQNPICDYVTIYELDNQPDLGFIPRITYKDKETRRVINAVLENYENINAEELEILIDRLYRLFPEIKENKNSAIPDIFIEENSVYEIERFFKKRKEFKKL